MNNHNAANPGTIITLSIKLTQIISQVKVDKGSCADMIPQGACQQIR